MCYCWHVCWQTGEAKEGESGMTYQTQLVSAQRRLERTRRKMVQAEDEGNMAAYQVFSGLENRLLQEMDDLRRLIGIFETRKRRGRRL